MKFEIANPVDEIEPIKAEKVVRLGLIIADDIVYLAALDEKNNVIDDGYLLGICADGSFVREDKVNPDLGFPLTEDGMVKLL